MGTGSNCPEKWPPDGAGSCAHRLAAPRRDSDRIHRARIPEVYSRQPGAASLFWGAFWCDILGCCWGVLVKSIQKMLSLAAIAVGAAGLAQAQVPPEIAKQLVTIGRGVCVPETAKLYRPMHANPPYTGVTIHRDISFGPDPKDVLDVFAPEKGGGNRPVLIYVSGGAGNKLQGGPNGDVFYDNIMLWAVKNGMVGVNMQRHPGAAWDDPGKAVGMVVQWVAQNIAMHKGNPARVFIWSQSAGNAPVGNLHRPS